LRLQRADLTNSISLFCGQNEFLDTNEKPGQSRASRKSIKPRLVNAAMTMVMAVPAMAMMPVLLR